MKDLCSSPLSASTPLFHVVHRSQLVEEGCCCSPDSWPEKRQFNHHLTRLQECQLPLHLNSYLAQFGFVKRWKAVFGHHDDSTLVAILPQRLSTNQGSRTWSGFLQRTLRNTAAHHHIYLSNISSPNTWVATLTLDQRVASQLQPNDLVPMTLLKLLPPPMSRTVCLTCGATLHISFTRLVNFRDCGKTNRVLLKSEYF